MHWMAKEDFRTAGNACLLDGPKLQHCLFEIDLPASIVHTLRAWRVYYYTANYLAQGWSYMSHSEKTHPAKKTHQSKAPDKRYAK